MNKSCVSGLMDQGVLGVDSLQYLFFSWALASCLGVTGLQLAYVIHTLSATL